VIERKSHVWEIDGVKKTVVFIAISLCRASEAIWQFAICNVEVYVLRSMLKNSTTGRTEYFQHEKISCPLLSKVAFIVNQNLNSDSRQF
jgi:hypothetical protein